jgi:hypothetical protein
MTTLRALFQAWPRDRWLKPEALFAEAARLKADGTLANPELHRIIVEAVGDPADASPRDLVRFLAERLDRESGGLILRMRWDNPGHAYGFEVVVPPKPPRRPATMASLARRADNFDPDSLLADFLERRRKTLGGVA